MILITGMYIFMFYFSILIFYFFPNPLNNLQLLLCRTEGRSWYTTHRGRLWIAATVQEPAVDTISSVEKMCKTLHQGSLKKFKSAL